MKTLQLLCLALLLAACSSKSTVKHAQGEFILAQPESPETNGIRQVALYVKKGQPDFYWIRTGTPPYTFTKTMWPVEK